MSTHRKTFLTIESAIRGGSIALFSNGQLAAWRVGDGDRSRSEDLLQDVDAVLGEAGIKKELLEEIYVSLGPGSFTGIRIGVATAMGLGDSLNIVVRGIPLFDAIGNTINVWENFLIVLPVGRKDFIWQGFVYEARIGHHRSDKPMAGPLVSLEKAIREKEFSRVHCHSSIAEIFKPQVGPNSEVETIGPNLAVDVGRTVLAGIFGSEVLEPIYVSNSANG